MKAGLTLAVVLLLAACGGEAPAPAPRMASVPPAEPEAALAWVAEVQDNDVRVRARLDAWPYDVEEFEYAEETQIAWTWRLQLALRDGDIERAGLLAGLLRSRFDGRGQYPEGRALSPDAVRFAVFEEGLLEARHRVEGLRPDPVRAREALDVAGQMLLPADTKDRERLAGTLAWVECTQLEALLTTLGSAAAVGERLQATLVVIADDFTLGESIFLQVLKQWGDNHAEARFDRRLVPLLRGQVRYGLRLVPAESHEAEVASIEARCAEAGLTCEKPLAVERLAGLGLREGEAALVLADGAGRIVARLSGRNPDPRVLEPALQRLLSR